MIYAILRYTAGKELLMKQITIKIEDVLYDFYRKIGENVGKSPERTMEDALFRLAGEMAMEAIYKNDPSQ